MTSSSGSFYSLLCSHTDFYRILLICFIALSVIISVFLIYKYIVMKIADISIFDDCDQVCLYMIFSDSASSPSFNRMFNSLEAKNRTFGEKKSPWEGAIV